MKTKTILCSVVVLWCLGLATTSLADVVESSVKTIDIALQGNGLLVGQVVNNAGQPLPDAVVSVSSNGKEIHRCKTAKTGYFQVAGLKGGTIEVSCLGVAGNCRIWAHATSPPAAQQGLLIVVEDDVVRGQHMGGPVSGPNYGPRGSLQGMIIDHPLVTAGAVGAAIAIPIAVSNHSPPATP